jgi:phosphoserine phosphatase
MITIKSTKIVYFDVDSTLVTAQSDLAHLEEKLWIEKRGRRFYIHNKHGEILQDFKARGHTVVVWSAGGAEWAETVVKLLGLTESVDLCIDKPDWYFDDLKADVWLEGKHCYLKDEV